MSNASRGGGGSGGVFAFAEVSAAVRGAFRAARDDSTSHCSSNRTNPAPGRGSSFRIPDHHDHCSAGIMSSFRNDGFSKARAMPRSSSTMRSSSGRGPLRGRGAPTVADGQTIDLLGERPFPRRLHRRSSARLLRSRAPQGASGGPVVRETPMRLPRGRCPPASAMRNPVSRRGRWCRSASPGRPKGVARTGRDHVIDGVDAIRARGVRVCDGRARALPYRRGDRVGSVPSAAAPRRAECVFRAGRESPRPGAGRDAVLSEGGPRGVTRWRTETTRDDAAGGMEARLFWCPKAGVWRAGSCGPRCSPCRPICSCG